MIQIDAARDRVARAKRLERSVMLVRWFGVLVGAYQVYAYEPNPGTIVPPSVTWFASGALLLLVAANAAVILALPRIDSEARVRRLGAAVYGIDIVALWILIWTYSFEIWGTTWVLLTVVALEGAFRRAIRGGMTPAATALVLEPLREAFMNASFGRPFFVSSVIYRIAVVAMVGYLAGVMARDLQRERQRAEERATDLAELAERETAARRESTAFQQVILAGVSASDLRQALSSMLSHIATELGYERSAVLILEEDGRLYPAATHGFADWVIDESLDLGEGISGVVAETGRAEIVPDVELDPRYFRLEPAARSQITVPIMRGDAVVGVLDVESEHVGAFDEADRARLERLAAQMALVIEQARLLARERATVERLRELDVMKSDFVAIASHELRTPLTAMKGSIRTLRRPEISTSSPVESELLEVLDRQTERLARLVEDLLVVSRIDAGAVSLSIDSVDVRALLRDVVADLGPAAARRVSIAAPDDLPTILTDGQRLTQIARNLVENAVKFSPADTMVRVTIHHDGNQLAMAVSDDGPGIAPEDVSKIFERFHQVGGSLKRRSEGFGLGLYITKRLVDALRGTVAVDSTLGRGTTFTVRIPSAFAGEGASEIA